MQDIISVSTLFSASSYLDAMLHIVAYNHVVGDPDEGFAELLLADFGEYLLLGVGVEGRGGFAHNQYRTGLQQGTG